MILMTIIVHPIVHPEIKTKFNEFIESLLPLLYLTQPAV